MNLSIRPVDGIRQGVRPPDVALTAFLMVVSVLSLTPLVQAQQNQRLGPVFVIALENHNWTQPNGNVTGTSLQQIKNNSHAPFITALVNGTATATINGLPTNISAQTAYSNTYYNVLANAQSSVSIHPSEPNYIWAEAGSNLGVLNDNDPYQSSGGTNQTTTQHLCTYLTRVNISWKSYQEDIDINTTTGQVLPPSQWTVPLVSFSGTLSSSTGTPNIYNGSLQYSYGAKHNPTIFFSDTNGGDNATVNNAAVKYYAPLQQLNADLQSNNVAAYNWITPNLYNDMHTALSGGFKGYTGDSAAIAQGDNFVATIVPIIMASQAYQNNGVIVIRMDETEAQNGSDTKVNDFNHTIPEIVISRLVHPNVGGLPYASSVAMTHSSDLKTWQELFEAGPDEGFAFLGDAASTSTNSLGDLLVPTVEPFPQW